MVHSGFRKAWEYEGYGQKLINWLRERVCPEAGGEAGDVAKRRRVLVTGHSLGAGLATLCAFNIATQLPGGWVGGRVGGGRPRWGWGPANACIPAGPSPQPLALSAHLDPTPSLHTYPLDPFHHRLLQRTLWSCTATPLARPGQATMRGPASTLGRCPTPGAARCAHGGIASWRGPGPACWPCLLAYLMAAGRAP